MNVIASLHIRFAYRKNLWFHFPDDWPGERMWVIVKDVRPGYYVGVLNNYPFTDCMHFGQKVQFHPDHVLDIDRKREPAIAGGSASPE